MLLLIHVSRYIHLNPIVAGLVDDLNKYPWSSYPDYIGIRNETLCQKEEILRLFGESAREKYEKFVLAQIDYAKELHKLKAADAMFD